jgi:hypothetical protein
MNIATIEQHVLERLGENPASPQFYKPAEVLAAVNTAQRMFCLLTLCLEATATLALGTDVFYWLLTQFSDFLLPLRVRVSAGSPLAGTRVKPVRLQDLDALDPNWQAANGTPERYACLGFDFVAFYKVPAAPNTGVGVDITYARSPLVMTAASTPEIPEEDHPALEACAIPLLRAKEGGSEFQKAVPLFDVFMAAATKRANYVKARNLAQRYDRVPFALDRFDRSKLIIALAMKKQKPAALDIPQAQEQTNG